MQSDQIGHRSHLSDLPSKGAPIECSTVCDTCYLKRLLIHIQMILMYHNKNVTSPIWHNKYKHCTDNSTHYSWVIICIAQPQSHRNFGMSFEYVHIRYKSNKEASWLHAELFSFILAELL